MEFNIEHALLLLLVAGVVSMVAERFHIPYTVGLVTTGFAMTFLPFIPAIALTKTLIFNLLLPPLIFEAALFIPWKALRKDFSIITLMATVGVVFAALITTFGMVYLLGWPLMSAAIFGILISATDPVSVIATFKDAGVHGRIRLLVEAESLFNDGTAAVIFSLLIAFATGTDITTTGIILKALLIVGGSLSCGAIVAFFALYLAGRTKDPLVRISFTMFAAYGSFLLAEHFHWSGILATLTAGLIVGNRDLLQDMPDKSRESVESFWEFAAFMANSLIFLLIGIHEARQDFSSLWPAVLLAIALVTFGRAFAIYPISWAFSRSTLKLTGAQQHIMFWGGLRGALALGLALGLPEGLPYRHEIVTVAYAVVAFSVIVQGLSMTPLLRLLGELPRHSKAKKSAN